MSRIMAIDFGLKRTGLAVTDELQIIAQPLDTVPTSEIWDFLQDYCQQENVECVVIGEPRGLDNQETHATASADAFTEKFAKRFPNIRIERMDERYTSKMAQRSMIDAGFKKKERRKKENLDKISAALILQSYLAERSL